MSKGNLMRHVLIAVSLAVLGGCMPSNPAATTPSSNSTSAVPSAFNLAVGKKWSYEGTVTTDDSESRTRLTYEVVSVNGNDFKVKGRTEFLSGASAGVEPLDLDLEMTVHNGLITAKGELANAVSGMVTNTEAGSETVTVKAGTFTARKYTQTVQGVEGGGTLWYVGPFLVKQELRTSAGGIVSTNALELVSISP